jgi:hypothetical protein
MAVLGSALAGQTIILSTIGDTNFGPSAFVVTGNLTIDGTAAPGMILNRNTSGPAMRLFRIATNGILNLTNLTLENGSAQGVPGGNGNGGGGGGAGLGGAIYNTGSLMASNVNFTSNHAAGGSGGAYASTQIGGNGGGPTGGAGGLPYGSNGTNGGFGSGGGGTAGANGEGTGGTSGFGAGAGAGNGGANFGGSGGFGGGGGGGNACGGGGGLGAGGSIFNNGGLMALNQCVFNGGSATAGAGGAGSGGNVNGAAGSALGGAVFNYNSLAFVANCVFSNNAASSGADFYTLGDATNSSLTMSGVTMSDGYMAQTINGGVAQTLGHADSIAAHGSPWFQGEYYESIPNGASVTFNLALTQPPGSPTFTVTSSNQNVFPASGLSFTGSGSIGTLTATAANSGSGVSQITATIAYGGVSYSEWFTLAVGPDVPPVAASYSASVDQSQSVTVSVLATDSSPDNNSLTLVSVTQPAHGTATINGSTVTYANNGSTYTNDSFVYQVADGYGGVSTGTVSINVLPPPTIIVSTVADSGAGSLRNALASANSLGLGRIVFSNSLSNQKIQLASQGDFSFGVSALSCQNGFITIDGSSAPGLTLSVPTGGFPMRILQVYGGSTLQLISLTLEGGTAQGGNGDDGGSGGGGGGAGLGGAIYSEGTLIVSNCVVVSNTAAGGAGGFGGDGTENGVLAGGGGPNGGSPGGLDSNGNWVVPGDGGFGGGGGGAPYTGIGGSAGFGAGSAGDLSGDGFPFPAGSGGFGGGSGGTPEFGGGGGLGAGGAIFNNGGTATILNSTITNNLCEAGAGGGSVSNTAYYNGQPGSAFGGAVFNYDGQLFITNTVMSGNSADSGGGIYLLTDMGANQVSLSGVTANDPNGGTDFVPEVMYGADLQIFETSNIFSSKAPPFIGAIANVTASGTVTITVPTSEPGPGDTYSLTASSANPVLFPAPNLVINGSGPTATLTLTPAAGQTGSAAVTVTLIDNGVSVATTFQVTIGVTVSTPNIISANIVTNGGFHLHFLATTKVAYTVLASIDMKNWTAIGAAAETSSGVFDFTDLQASFYSHRYYRIQLGAYAGPVVPKILNQSRATNTFHLLFQGAANLTYGVQSSTNLINWTLLGLINQSAPGIYNFADTNSVSLNHRFYRISSP